MKQSLSAPLQIMLSCMAYMAIAVVVFPLLSILQTPSSTGHKTERKASAQNSITFAAPSAEETLSKVPISDLNSQENTPKRSEQENRTATNLPDLEKYFGSSDESPPSRPEPLPASEQSSTTETRIPYVPDTGWKTARLTRFGFKLSVPPSFERSPINSGMSAVDIFSDGAMTVTMMGNYGGSLEGQWESALQRNGESVTYKVIRNDYFVVSGVQPNGIEYYERVWCAGNDNFCSFRATYPHNYNHIYDPVIERMMKEFDPFPYGRLIE